ncbi:MAG: hypothetical protein V1781_06720 [Bacteroidota bacterium]
MRYLILIPFLLACQMSSLNTLQKVYVIKQDGNLLEKRYVDNNNTTRIVTYDIETKQPNDSIVLGYDEKGNLVSAKAYSFVERKYEANELLTVGDYYLQAYGIDSSCDNLLPMKYRFLMEDVVSNVCGIQQSVLPNGGIVSSLAKTTKNKEIIEISCSDINAKFNLPYDIFQLYFYNQSLISFNLQIKDGHLMKETYYFSDGIFVREFFYDETSELKKSVADVRYKNEVSKKITKTYEIE